MALREPMLVGFDLPEEEFTRQREEDRVLQAGEEAVQRPWDRRKHEYETLEEDQSG